MKVLLMKPIGGIYYVIQPNLGFGYLATIMLEHGHDVRIVDSGKEDLQWGEFTEMVRTGGYDVIGIQMFTHEIPAVMEHVRIIRRESPKTRIVVGGAHMSGDPEGTMELLDIDFGFVGESEIGVEKFMRLKKGDYSKPELLRTIPNLVWRDNGKVVVNKRESIDNLDEIKYPAWHLIPPSSYPTNPHGSFCKRPPVAPIVISRGCPFQCTFCAGRMVTGRKLRYRSIKNVIDEIVMLHDNYGVREIHIEDDNFTFNRSYVKEFCTEVLKLPFKLSFALPNGVRLDTMDEELLRLMEKTGFYSMAVGIESGSNRILKMMKKRLSKEVVRQRIDLIKKCTGINVTGFFMIGYPGETKEEILESIEFAKTLGLDKASFTHVMPLPGTELWDIYRRRVDKKDWSNFFSYRIVEGLSDIPLEDLRGLHKKAMWEFYFRPRIILGLISEIRTLSQLKVIGKRGLDIFLAKGKAARS